MASTAITVGRRKTAKARVYLTPGSGTITINGKTALEFFKAEEPVTDIIQPLKLTETLGTFDVNVNVDGGGVKGQIGAIRLGIARALIIHNEELKPVLRQNGMVTRDPRMVERKKYGQPKARKRFQFSKR
ncbi:MAG: 30S ribosomal protein S9 [Ignavibacteriae bacterium]|jgi:small subunit ribosomal protein S9|nr:30S ribosomal protein S9 [Ignavibacteriota bacterium]